MEENTNTLRRDDDLSDAQTLWLKKRLITHRVTWSGIRKISIFKKGRQHVEVSWYCTADIPNDHPAAQTPYRIRHVTPNDHPSGGVYSNTHETVCSALRALSAGNGAGRS